MTDNISKVLVKFFFTNPKLIPAGIRLIDRREDRIEKAHGDEARKLGISFGGKRPDREDTGVCETSNNVNFASTWEQLKDEFDIVDTHCFFQKRSQGMKKLVVIVTFSEDKNENGHKPNKTSLQSFIETIEKNFTKHGTWGTVHHWTNPDGTETFNCLKRQPTQS